ncbi:MAG: hypothetical protein GX045_07715 [Clostridiaceae bacterium]|jgi:hypothetical protein|nr:hypothetical protein [Clostridiaceae bacterium]
MEKKKLVVNCAVCDARNVTESTLKSYEKIEINAASVFVSKEAKEIFSLYNVSINAADINEIPQDVEVMVQNGAFELSETTVISRPAVLVVNGSLNIKNGAQNALGKIISILVNGQVSYPSNLQDYLPSIKVNGSTDSYPHDAIRLKNKLIIDNPFIIKAKESAKYYVKNKVVIPDETLNISKLAGKGVSFITKKAIIAENLLEAALPLFNEDADTVVIPAGYSYIAGGKLDDVLIRKHGDKLYVDGDFIVTLENSNALEKITSIRVNGAVLIVENLMDKLNAIDAEYENIKTIKGTLIEDKGILSIDKRMLESNEHGITVSDCGVVKLKDDITPEDIEKKLQFTDCGCIFCNEEQKSSVELVSEDVGQIVDNNNESGFLKGIIGGSDLYNNETQVINAANYTM